MFLLFIPARFSFPNDIIQKNFYFQTRDGTRLDCSIYSQNNGENRKYPAIIFCHGFGKSKDDYYQDAIEYAASGFCCITYTFRGQGLSGGSTFFIDRTDMHDLFDVVSFVKSRDFVDSNRIIISGASQGGIIPLMAAANGLVVNCIITDLASFDYISDWLYNNTVKTSFIWSLGYTSDVVRYDSSVLDIRSKILKGIYNPLEQLRDFIEMRDFSNAVNNIKIPVLISNSWQDKFFSSNSIIRNINKLSSYHNIFLGIIKGHGSEDYENEHKYHSQIIKDWIDKNINNTESENVKKYMYTATKLDKNGNIKLIRNSSDDFPFIHNEELSLYLNAKNSISHEENNSDGYFEIKNLITDTTLDLRESIFSEFKSNKFKNGFINSSYIFESKPINKDYFFSGIPSAELFISTQDKYFQLNIQIYEIKDNKEHFITSINFNTYNNNSNIAKYYFEGIAGCHMFSKGNKIRLKFTNIDTRNNDKFLRTNPFVLPIFNNFSLNIHYGKQKSRIILPVKSN